MRIFDETKTNELKEIDTKKGYLVEDKLLIASHNAIEAVEEQGHYETVKEYANGGKDVKWVVDAPGVEAKDAWEEYEDINVFIPYTVKQLVEIEIAELKQKLAATDYQAIKYAEGAMSAEEYQPIKAQRQEWRNRINQLEEV